MLRTCGRVVRPSSSLVVYKLARWPARWRSTTITLHLPANSDLSEKEATAAPAGDAQHGFALANWGDEPRRGDDAAVKPAGTLPLLRTGALPGGRESVVARQIGAGPGAREGGASSVVGGGLKASWMEASGDASARKSDAALKAVVDLRQGVTSARLDKAVAVKAAPGATDATLPSPERGESTKAPAKDVADAGEAASRPRMRGESTAKEATVGTTDMVPLAEGRRANKVPVQDQTAKEATVGTTDMVPLAEGRRANKVPVQDLSAQVEAPPVRSNSAMKRAKKRLAKEAQVVVVDGGSPAAGQGSEQALAQDSTGVAQGVPSTKTAKTSKENKRKKKKTRGSPATEPTVEATDAVPKQEPKQAPTQDMNGKTENALEKSKAAKQRASRRMAEEIVIAEAKAKADEAANEKAIAESVEAALNTANAKNRRDEKGPLARNQVEMLDAASPSDPSETIALLGRAMSKKELKMMKKNDKTIWKAEKKRAKKLAAKEKEAQSQAQKQTGLAASSPDGKDSEKTITQNDVVPQDLQTPMTSQHQEEGAPTAEQLKYLQKTREQKRRQEDRARENRPKMIGEKRPGEETAEPTAADVPEKVQRGTPSEPQDAGEPVAAPRKLNRRQLRAAQKAKKKLAEMAAAELAAEELKAAKKMQKTQKTIAKRAAAELVAAEQKAKKAAKLNKKKLARRAAAELAASVPEEPAAAPPRKPKRWQLREQERDLARAAARLTAAGLESPVSSHANPAVGVEASKRSHSGETEEDGSNASHFARSEDAKPTSTESGDGEQASTLGVGNEYLDPSPVERIQERRESIDTESAIPHTPGENEGEGAASTPAHIRGGGEFSTIATHKEHLGSWPVVSPRMIRSKVVFPAAIDTRSAEAEAMKDGDDTSPSEMSKSTLAESLTSREEIGTSLHEGSMSSSAEPLSSQKRNDMSSPKTSMNKPTGPQTQKRKFSTTSFKALKVANTQFAEEDNGTSLPKVSEGYSASPDTTTQPTGVDPSTASKTNSAVTPRDGATPSMISKSDATAPQTRNARQNATPPSHTTSNSANTQAARQSVEASTPKIASKKSSTPELDPAELQKSPAKSLAALIRDLLHPDAKIKKSLLSKLSLLGLQTLHAMLSGRDVLVNDDLTHQGTMRTVFAYTAWHNTQGQMASFSGSKAVKQAALRQIGANTLILCESPAEAFATCQVVNAMFNQGGLPAATLLGKEILRESQLSVWESNVLVKLKSKHNQVIVADLNRFHTVLEIDGVQELLTHLQTITVHSSRSAVWQRTYAILSQLHAFNTGRKLQTTIFNMGAASAAYLNNIARDLLAEDHAVFKTASSAGTSSAKGPPAKPAAVKPAAPPLTVGRSPSNTSSVERRRAERAQADAARVSEHERRRTEEAQADWARMADRRWQRPAAGGGDRAQEKPAMARRSADRLDHFIPPFNDRRDKRGDRKLGEPRVTSGQTYRNGRGETTERTRPRHHSPGKPRNPDQGPASF